VTRNIGYIEMRDVLMKFIPLEGMRYSSAGDWIQRISGGWDIKVLNLEDWRYRFLISVHEFIEMALCVQRGIDDQVVTEFDVAFEKNRKPGDDSEPGDDPKAPYFREHQLASEIEKRLAAELGVDWESYEHAVCNALQPGVDHA